ncbi:hypothetical protein [Anatilimnocola aggregata]|uniref:hypothetical protein n=1 Tax=Anatilimnocola aggregata TaxID=2528021 RepID=UPI0011A38A14|nr:hypothetical protein [Anatilimnocola aggregata]
MESKPQPPPLQQLVLLVALFLVALIAIPSWMVVLGCYLVALLLVNIRVAWLPRWPASGISWFRLALLAIVPAVLVGRMLGGQNPAKQLGTLRENIADRWALEQTPSIAPGLLVTYQPQRYLIHAPGENNVSVRWTSESPELPAIDLGNGVHLLDFDPRSDVALTKLSGNSLTCTIIAGGKPHQRVLRLIQPQAHPRQLRSDATVGIAATVSEETDELLIVRRDGTHHRVAVGDGPTDCAVFDSGHKIVVAHRFEPELWVIDTAQAKVLSRVPAGTFQCRLAISDDRQRLAVALDGVQPGIRLFDLPALTELSFVPLKFSPDLLEFGSARDELIVTDRRGRGIVRLAEQPREQTSESGEKANAWAQKGQTLFFPRPISTLGKTPEPTRLALATTASFLTSGQPLANHFLENTVHTLDLDQWAIVATQITDRRGLEQDSPGDTEHGISPLALGVIDNRLYAAFAGSNEVSELSPNGVAKEYLSLDSYPLFAPQGLADLGNGLWSVSSPVDGNIGLFDLEGNLQHLISFAAAEDELAKSNPAELARRQGERTFFEGTRAGIACQSCHLGADSDFCLHDIGQGKPVDVLSVRGVIGTSPYLRDASHWRLRDLHDVAVDGYRDYQDRVPWDRAAALDAYLQSLPLNVHARQREKLDVEKMRTGVSAFFAADCATCHAPPALTNLGQQSAASLFPDYYGPMGPAAGADNFLDTPTLRGISLSPPYLHDGRAPTLRAVLSDWNRAGRHGNTKILSNEQLNDLIYLLEQL